MLTHGGESQLLLWKRNGKQSKMSGGLCSPCPSRLHIYPSFSVCSFSVQHNLLPWLQPPEYWCLSHVHANLIFPAFDRMLFLGTTGTSNSTNSCLDIPHPPKSVPHPFLFLITFSGSVTLRNFLISPSPSYSLNLYQVHYQILLVLLQICLYSNLKL